MRNMTKIKRVIEFCNFGIMKLFVVLIADFQVSVGGFFLQGQQGHRGFKGEKVGHIAMSILKLG